MFFYQISTLTADVDIINSTVNSTGKPAADVRPGAGDDEFIAGASGTAATLNPGDQLDGLGGTDTLKVYGNDSVANLTNVTIKNIEIVQAIGTGTSGSTAVDVSANADVKEVWLVKAANANTVTATTAQTVGVEGKATGTQTVTYSGDTDGTADAATIMLKGANTSAVTIAPAGADVVTIEKLTLEATGKNVLGTLTDATLTDLVIKGTGSVEATVVAATSPASATLKTIDASANKGGVDLTLTTGDLVAAGTTITGGSGDDTISFTTTTAGVKFAVDLGAGDDTFVVNTGVKAGSVIKGGDGTADTLSVSTGYFDGTTPANGKMFTGFEVMELTGSSAAYKIGQVAGINTINVEATTSAVTNMADKSGVVVTGNIGTSLTLTLASEVGRNTLDVGFDNGATSAAAGVAVAAADTKAEILNFHSNGMVNTTANSVVLSGDTLANLDTVSIDGTQAFSLTTGVSTKGLTINTTGLSGHLTVDGNAATTKALSITTGSGGSLITGSVLGDEIKFGTGADVMNYTTLTQSHDDSITTGLGKAFDVISNFGAEDKIDVLASLFTGNGAPTTGAAIKIKSFEYGANGSLPNTGTDLFKMADGTTAQFAAAVLTNSNGEATTLLYVNTEFDLNYNQAADSSDTSYDMVIKLAGTVNLTADNFALVS